jgi:serine kinase of HPr protein (carbohydrate metabolism regulator)
MRALDISVRHLLAGSERRLGIRQVIGERGLSNHLRHIHVQHYIHDDTDAALVPDVIMIINPACDHPLTHGDHETRLRFFKEIHTANIPCVFMSASGRIEDHLYPDIEWIGIPHIVSALDMFLLESRLKGLLREKFEHRVRMHGVLLNMFGLGVMIRGDSGTGKTTLGVNLVRKGHTWIADDAIEIEQRNGRRLYAQGCDSIRHLIDLKECGICHAKSIFADSQVAGGTNLNLILEIEEWDGPPDRQKSAYSIESVVIMGKRLPCIHIPRFRDHDFDLPEIEKRVRAFNRSGESS